MTYSKEYIMHRHPENPIIRPSDIPLADIVFNPGQTMYQGKTLLLISVGYRTLVEGRISGLYIATSEDGVHFDIEDKPFISTVEQEPYCNKYDWRTIDPRITKIEDTYYIIRPCQHRAGTTPLLEKTKEWKK